MSLLMWWRELGFWMGLAMWAATRCFGAVDIYVPEDEVIGMVWAIDDGFLKYVMGYEETEDEAEKPGSRLPHDINPYTDT
jgi:hypothetical protein